jgi:uncharacterized lipoprotein
VYGRKEALTEDERYALPSAQFPACAAASADSQRPSQPAKLPTISGTQAMREIDWNLL